MTQRNGRLVWATLLILIVIAIGVAASAGVALPLEKAALKAMAFRAGRTPDIVISLAQWITWMGDAAQRTVLLVVCAAWLFWKKRPRAALVVAIVPILASVMSSFLKEAFARARPVVVPHLDHVTNLSFPSGHATNAAAAFLLIAFLVPGKSPSFRIALAVFGALLIGGSRLALGVHWPSDVIGGWLLGFAFALAGFEIANQLEKRA